MREVIFPRLAGAIALALLAWPALAADTPKPAYSPYVGKDYPVRPLFGCNDILQADGRQVTLCID